MGFQHIAPEKRYRGGGKPGRKARQPYRLKTHGQYKTTTYKSWDAAKQRCYNPRNNKFPLYGALGVTMCEHWRTSFANFLTDMGPRPPKHSLDRWPDPHGNYEPSNCRWATIHEQRANRRWQKRAAP